MRQTRRLALMLAAQFIPFAAYAQTAPSNPPAAAGANQDDEDSEEESSSSASTEATPEETPADDLATETDDARRTRILPRFSTLDGSIGLLHTAAAQLGGAGSFRFGLTGEFSSSTGFLRPSALSATALVGGEDDARHVGGTLTLSYSPLDFLEIFGSVRAYANANNRERPSLFQVLGDSNLGVKAAFRVHRGIYVGGDLAVFLLNRSGDVGLNFDSTSFQIRAIGTLDLQELTRSVPLRVHLNARYYFDNSAAIVSDVEARRRAAQPGFDPAICATTNDPRCFLEVSRIERYALGVNRTDQLGINVAVDANLPYVNPFLEWSVGVPVNRQGYQCYLAPSSGTRPGGAADDDGCLDQEGFSAVPSRLTIGARVLPPVRGLSGTLAVDIATSGASTFVRELAPTTPWQIFFGAAFAYDIHAPERRVEVPGPERIVNRDVDRTPPGGTVNGTVRDAESHSGVNHAIVTFTGHPELHILASAADGTFRSGHIPPGDYRVHVEADGYNPNDCNFTIPAPAAPAAPAGDANAAVAPAAAPAPVVVTSQCELRPLPRRGTLTGHVVSSQGGAGVGNATVTLSPAQGAQQGATEQTATTDAQGNFTLSDVLAGPYTVSVGATPQHMATTPQAVTVEARRSVNVDITATRRPARPSAVLRGGVIAVTRQIHFQVNSAEILPDSTTLVEEIADVIRRNPTLTAIEIQGHTDNTGVPANNLTLSQSRADSVRDALVRLGIPAEKLTARGFGQTRPVRPNITAAGRAANRRVEFHVTRAR